MTSEFESQNKSKFKNILKSHYAKQKLKFNSIDFVRYKNSTLRCARVLCYTSITERTRYNCSDTIEVIRPMDVMFVHQDIIIKIKLIDFI